MDRLATLRERKLVVLGIPFDVEREELKYYMRKFGELEDCTIIRDHMTGKSRGFGYVTFLTVEDAKKAAAASHALNGRRLDVKVATPKEEMMASSARKGSRIFVARIPAAVTEEMFRNYFQKYGVIIDAYMPKDAVSKAHRGIGFVTFEHPDSVDDIMRETHELGGSTIAVDRATPKDETVNNPSTKAFADPYSMYSAYMAAAAAAAAAFGMGEGVNFSAFPAPMAVGLENPSGGESVPNTGEGDVAVQGHDGGHTVSPAAEVGAPNAAYAAFMAAAAAAAASAGYGPPLPPSYGGEHMENATPSTVVPPDSHSNRAYQTGSGDVVHELNVPSASTVSTVNPNEETGYGQAASYSCPSGYGSVSSSNQSTLPQTGMFPSGYKDTEPYIDPSTAPASSTGYYARSGSGHNVHPSGARYEDYYGASSGYGYGAAYTGTHATYTSPAYNTGASYGSSGAVPIAPDAYGGSGHPYNNAAANVPEKYGSGGGLQGGNRIYICKLPHEATAEHLRTYFSGFGRVVDVYLPKDPKKTGHRGFGFVTFFDDNVAERVAQEAHEILGQPIAVDRPRPHDTVNSPYPTNFSSRVAAASWETQAAAQRAGYGGSSDYFYGWDPYSSGAGGPPEAGNVHRVPRTDGRFRPY